MKISNAIKQTIIDPLKAFLADSRAIGIILLVATAVSLLIANLPAGQQYLDFWHIEFHAAAQWHLPHSLLHVINDGLMALFFFLAGMEIKSEMVGGELSSLKKSLLPVFGAIGGMLVPALIYILFNKGSSYSQGWGIPTATDIAFSLGIASLLGSRIPASLKIFLTALAIIDDLGAILIIALFYGDPIRITWLLACVAIIIVLVLLFKKSSQLNFLHIALGLLLWYCMFNTGIHATVAGVLFAFLIPVQHLHPLQLKLHKPVYFVVMPIFALANTAIIFPANTGAALTSSLSWGIMLGLFIGKPLGICSICYYLVKRNYADLPSAVNWKQLAGAGLLAGIGFTMSIFIATLAFSDPAHQDIAKIAVLLVSFLSMLAGYFWLKYASKKPF
jgi:NhaA family Na+:H+ antiporter